jgi:thiol-disulfide isomerase/thioredoxin
LLNVWATWCPPCREEMPSLDRLQVKLGGPAFEIVAVSIDRGGASVVDGFFRTYRLRSLQRYIGESDTTLRRLGSAGVPTTLLIDRQGREVWRHAGAAVWDRDEMVQFMRKTMAAPD